MNPAFVFFITAAVGLFSYFNYLALRLNLKWIPPEPSWLRHALVGFVVFSALSFIAARFIERITVNRATDFLVWWGSLWLAFLLYNLLLNGAVGLCLWVASFFWSLPPQAKSWGGMASAVLTVLTLAWGWRQAHHTVVRELDLALAKPIGVPASAAGPARNELRVALVSDIHMGSLIGRRRIEGLARRVNALSPDLVLIAGDAIDEDLAPVLRQNTGEALRQLSAPLGVWACTGNHEYIGGVGPAVNYLEAHGVRELRDAWADLGPVIVVGREDVSGFRFGGARRKELFDIMAGVDKSKPILLMDHQPGRLGAAEAAGVDVQVSGHTHHGQLWPLTVFTKLMFEVSYGYKKKGNTHVYVSCGFGTWGPPVRVGSRSEIVLLKLKSGG